MNLVWLRNDMRIEDNPALYNSCLSGETLCIFIITQKQWQFHHDSPQKIQFWRERLKVVAKELGKLNIPLKLLETDDYSTIPHALNTVIEHYKIKSVFFNLEYPLNEKNRDTAVIEFCTKNNIEVKTYHGDIIHPPGTVRTKTDTIYHVYSPFARQWRKQVDESQLNTVKTPKKQNTLDIDSDDIDDKWKLINKEDYRQDLWPVSTSSIHKKLTTFSQDKVDIYKDIRDIPSLPGTSTLSPYLACGAISVRQCITAARQHSDNWIENTWVNELIWREFYRHLIAIYPHLSRLENFKKTNKAIPWENNNSHWQAWCEGKTGYPIVDAAMRQLSQTGWMHNRLRMVVAAFLTKLLLIDWRKGEAYFMDKLIDGDFASNNGGWQWAASTGADAAPYFRIFNPERQSQRFDPDGKFIKKFLPELSSLNKKSIHNPNNEERKSCQYPDPIIDYKFSRQRAMDVYANAMGKTK